jgi:hypothetical protein
LRRKLIALLNGKALGSKTMETDKEVVGSLPATSDV